MTWFKCAGGSGVVTLSKSDYDALPTAQKNNGTVCKVNIPASGTPGLISLNHFNDTFDNDEMGIKWLGVQQNGLNPIISHEKKKFGDSSLYLNWGPYIYTEQTDKLIFEGSDFTIDAWIYTTNSTDRQTFFAYALPEGSGVSYAVDLLYTYVGPGVNMWGSSTGNTWDLVNSDPGGGGIGTDTLTANAWHHVALVRNGTNLSLYLDGVSQASVTLPANAIAYPNYRQTLRLGLWDNGYYGYYGYIDEFCVRNYAVWTSNFTPPTQPYEKYVPAHDVLYYMSTEYPVSSTPTPYTGLFKEKYVIDDLGWNTAVSYRTFKKYDTTTAAVASFFYEDNGVTYCHPFCLLSTTAAGATYIADGVQIDSLYTITVDGTTLYYAEPGYLFDSSYGGGVANFPIQYLNSADDPYASYADGVQAFAQLALR